MNTKKLSDRLGMGLDAADWVIAEIRKLEAELDAARKAQKAAEKELACEKAANLNLVDYVNRIEKP